MSKDKSLKSTLEEVIAIDSRGLSYREKKAKIREEAIQWQAHFDAMDYYSVAEWTNYFEKMGKRYGLTREFRENGII